jgi:hypothetical protein
MAPFTHTLKGHSGAGLTLFRREGQFYVRKIAAHETANERLRLQAGKQRAAGAMSPAIVEEGMEDGRYFFVMEFVTGVSIAHLAREGMYPTVQASFETFVHQLLQGYMAKADGVIPPAAIHAKLAQVAARCTQNPALEPTRPRIDALLERLRQVDWPELPLTPCHGDLTLENILRSADGRFVLIDFDAPDLCSAYLDACKLLQDTSGFWCLRHLALEQPGSIAFTNARMGFEFVETSILNATRHLWPALVPHMFHFTVLHLLRTLPYSTDASQAAFTVRQAEILLARA